MQVIGGKVKKRPMCRLALFLMICILLADRLGFSWIWRSPAGPMPQKTARKEERILAEGYVFCQEEKVLDKQIITYLYLKQTILKIHSKIYPVRTVKCRIEGKQKDLEGCRIFVNGILTLPKVSGNPGEFHIRNYERGRKTDFYIVDTSVKKVLAWPGWTAQGLKKIQTRVEEIIESIYPEKEAGVWKAMILGEKKGLDTRLKEQYQTAGIIHILAISGLHMTMMGMAVWKGLLFIGCSVKVSGLLSFVLLYGYGMIIGEPATAFRALVMFGILAGGKIAGRAYDSATGLSIASMLLLMENPDLLWDGGFQLSVMAVGGLICFNSMKVKRKIFSGGFLWLFSLPVVVYHFYQVSVIGMLCNLLVIPLMPVLLGTGILSVFAGIWNIKAGSILGVFPMILLKTFEWVGASVEKFPFSVWTPGRITKIRSILYYILLGSICMLYKRNRGKQEKKSKNILLWAAGIMSLLMIVQAPWNQIHEVAVLDVGQGDGIVLQENHKGILIDSGSTSRAHVGKQVLIPYLKHQGITEITGIFVTHTDQDHINGIMEVLEEGKKGWLKIGQLFMPVWMEETEVGKELIGKTKRAGGNYTCLEKGDVVEQKNLHMLVIHPQNEDFSREPNDGSLVISCEFYGQRILFTGDLPSTQEEGLLEEILPCRILKVGHHGSDLSSDERFLEKIQPEIAVISCGEHNRYGHPGKETLNRLKKTGSRIFRTDQQGAVILKFYSSGKVKCTCPTDKGQVY